MSKHDAADYRPLVVAYRNGAAVRLSDVADVQDSVEDLRNEGLANGEPSVLAILYVNPVPIAAVVAAKRPMAVVTLPGIFLTDHG
jgi:multidrug efflux pump subunit AcrB